MTASRLRVAVGKPQRWCTLTGWRAEAYDGAPVHTMTLEPHSHIGSFEVLSLLGEGGMGTVYRARDHELKRDVAIKVLREDLSLESAALERFKREARHGLHPA